MDRTEQRRTVTQREQPMLFLQQSRFAGGCNASNEKERLRIANPERLQHIVAIEKSEVDILPGEFGVEYEPRFQQIWRQHPSCRRLEGRGKGLQLSEFNSHPGSHFMSAELNQVFAAFLECLHE